MKYTIKENVKVTQKFVHNEKSGYFTVFLNGLEKRIFNSKLTTPEELEEMKSAEYGDTVSLAISSDGRAYYKGGSLFKKGLIPANESNLKIKTSDKYDEALDEVLLVIDKVKARKPNASVEEVNKIVELVLKIIT